jgi:charged multivesicular body protein 2A
MKSQNTMAYALGDVTITMKRMNKSLNLPSIQKITSDFERLSEMQNIKQDLFSETIDQVLADDNEVDDSAELVNKILDEVGLSLSEQMTKAPLSIPANEGDKLEDEKLIKRLESLRKL